METAYLQKSFGDHAEAALAIWAQKRTTIGWIASGLDAMALTNRLHFQKRSKVRLLVRKDLQKSLSLIVSLPASPVLW